MVEHLTCRVPGSPQMVEMRDVCNVGDNYFYIFVYLNILIYS